MNSKQKVREQIIALAQRRQRPGSGSSLVALRERTARTRFPDLTPVLGPVPWAVVGAVATRLYMPERGTQKLDIVVGQRRSRRYGERCPKPGSSIKVS